MYEERSALVSDGFTWSSSESLAELERPERMAAIERNWEATQARKAAKRQNLPLAAVLAGVDVEEEEPEGCLICSL